MGKWLDNALKIESTENIGWLDTMRDIGIDVKPPTGEWDGDQNCPFYGSLRLRGQVLEGTISKIGMQKTITLERNNVLVGRYSMRLLSVRDAHSAELTVHGFNSKTTLVSSPMKKAMFKVRTSKAQFLERQQNAGHVLQRMQNKSFEVIIW